jgi:hypothetical protein
LTAAQESTTEPRTYPTLRLLDAVGRLADLSSKTHLIEPDDFLIQAKKEIDAKKTKVVASDHESAKFIDDMVIKFTGELRKRYR